MFDNICNGLTNFNSNSNCIICVEDEIDEEDYEEMKENTFVSEDDIDNMNDAYGSSDELYAIW